MILLKDGCTYIFTILPCRTVDDGEAPGDEVILHVHHHQRWARPRHLLDPLGPAEHELLLGQAATGADVEDVQQLIHLTGLHSTAKYLISLQPSCHNV